MPRIRPPTSTSVASSRCRREKVSSWPVSRFRARSPARHWRPSGHLFRCRAQLDQLEIARDRLQQIVEVVRDAAGQLADRFHLVGLHQRRFGPLALRHLALSCARTASRSASASASSSFFFWSMDGLGNGEHLGQQRPQQDGGRHAGRGGDRLDRRLGRIIAVPQVPDAHDMGQAARQDEQGEQPEHLAELDVAALADEGHQRDRDREIGGGDQRVGDDMGPDQPRVPHQAIAVRRIVAGEEGLSHCRACRGRPARQPGQGHRLAENATVVGQLANRDQTWPADIRRVLSSSSAARPG
jgi:hypothetical protein